MIPYEQLQGLKPLPDQVKRMKAVKHKRKIPSKRLSLTKKRRSFASYPNPKGGYGGPKDYRRGD